MCVLSLYMIVEGGKGQTCKNMKCGRTSLMMTTSLPKSFYDQSKMSLVEVVLLKLRSNVKP